MLGSQVLEVAIGITFVYLLLSLICSTLTEMIARIVGFRSGTLKTALAHLLQEGISQGELGQIAIGQIKGLDVARLYEHPMIKGLSMPGKVDNWFRSGAGRPSYIPADRFATAIFDSIMSAGKLDKPLTLTSDESAALDAAVATIVASDQKAADAIKVVKAQYGGAGSLKGISLEQKEALEKAAKKVTQTQKDVIDALIRKTTLLSRPYTLTAEEQQAINAAIAALPADSAQVKQYLEKLKKTDVLGGKDLQTQAAAAFQQLQNGLDEMSDSTFKSSLQAILDKARNEAKSWDVAVAAARTNVESWFDDYMNRVNGWYKRKVQLIILVMAFVIAIIGNVDTIAIGRALWTDATLREAVANQATTFVVEAEPPATEQPAADAGDAAQPQEQADTAATGAENGAQKPTVAELQQELRGLGLPIGWYAENDNQDTFWDNFMVELPAVDDPTPAEQASADKRLLELTERGQNIGDMGNRWLLKITGIFITALAVSLGAPFWFDLLSKLVNLRSTGQPAEETNGEKPEVKVSVV